MAMGDGQSAVVQEMARQNVEKEAIYSRRSKFWIGLICVVIILIFLYFYKPFEVYLVENIPNVHFNNVIFWFASFVGVIGYAIAVQVRVKGYGVVSWVTQLVIHEAHRRLDVGKTLLFSIWGFSDHFAWGLITANPYGVRALEKATRRRCVPERIRTNKRKMKAIGIEQTTYVKEETVVEVTAATSRIHTEFFLDHSELASMLASATLSAPWLLGNIQEGWEWFAFTFQDQAQIGLSPSEIDKMIKASDQVTRQAYSRMRVGRSHRWAQHTTAEARFIADFCKRWDIFCM